VSLGNIRLTSGKRLCLLRVNQRSSSCLFWYALNKYIFSKITTKKKFERGFRNALKGVGTELKEIINYV
jgi:hypothetical protein